jgi:hypothetical protein
MMSPPLVRGVANHQRPHEHQHLERLRDRAPTDPDEVGFYDGVTQSQQILGSTFTLERPPASITPAINLGAILAIADVPTQESAINAASQAVRSNAKYCPQGKTCQ